MGISSNQARFLSLTSRQVDLENRVQQICQRRLRLSSELEKVATSYNDSIGNRQMYTFNTHNSGISNLSIGSAASGTGIKGIKDTNGNNFVIIGQNSSAANISVTAACMIATATGTAGGLDSATALDIGGAVTTFKALGLSGSATSADVLEAAIRNGLVSIASKADEFTQSKTTIAGSDAGDYELRDWRTLPVIADELYKGDDVAAEDKYDRTISQINQQDKKLQLEQSSIEVEYKAVTSEKEAVKKILDTNATASFKYFS